MDIIKSPEAQGDIDEISMYIFERAKELEPALRWLKDLDAFLDRIARAPGMGTSRAAFGKGLRSVAFGNYLIFFRKIRGGVQILRIFHGARRWQRRLGKLP